MDDAERITINDIRAAGHCVLGARGWFERHDLDWKAFLRDGADPDVLLATGDALAVQVIERKQERDHG